MRCMGRKAKPVLRLKPGKRGTHAALEQCPQVLPYEVGKDPLAG